MVASVRLVSFYGAAGRVGVIDLSTCTSLTAEFGLALPAEVLVLYSRLRLPRGEVTVQALDEMLAGPRLEEAALELADAGVAAIGFACTSGSLLHGPGFDESLRARMENATGVPSTTTATGVLRALGHLGATDVCVGTPYVDEVNERERTFLEQAGFEVRRMVGLGKRYDREIGALTAAEVRALALDAFEPGCEALFLSCTNLPALPLIPELELELGVPVVSSISATIWDVLRVGGVEVADPARLGELLGEGR
jgi:maleate isomerase